MSGRPKEVYLLGKTKRITQAFVLVICGLLACLFILRFSDLSFKTNLFISHNRIWQLESILRGKTKNKKQ